MSSHTSIVSVPASPPIRGLVTAGVVICLLLFGGFGSWAALAPLSSAAIAPGVVKVDSNRKTLQHLEGGIIAELLVGDGDRVRRGQVVARLDALDSGADRDALTAQKNSYLAREARLVAQRDQKDKITFPAALTERGSDPAVAAILSGQEKIFSDQANTIASQIEVWQSRKLQYAAQITSTREQMVSLKRQAELLGEELESSRMLLKKGFERKPRVLQLERDLATITASLSAGSGKVAELQEQTEEAELQILTLRKDHAREVSEELREVQTARVDVEERLVKAAARFDRRDVTAPDDGTVMNLRYFAPGGVVPPGGPILDLIPSDDRLVIEARVQTLDIDVVHPGLEAAVRLVAFKQRLTPSLQGLVTRVSADVVTDERTGQPFFLATVEVPASEFKNLPSVKLYPGMPASVSIITGERTFLDYLIQPMTDSFAHAMREE